MHVKSALEPEALHVPFQSWLEGLYDLNQVSDEKTALLESLEAEHSASGLHQDGKYLNWSSNICKKQNVRKKGRG